MIQLPLHLVACRPPLNHTLYYHAWFCTLSFQEFWTPWLGGTPILLDPPKRPRIHPSSTLRSGIVEDLVSRCWNVSWCVWAITLEPGLCNSTDFNPLCNILWELGDFVTYDLALMCQMVSPILWVELHLYIWHRLYSLGAIWLLMMNGKFWSSLSSQLC